MSFLNDGNEKLDACCVCLDEIVQDALMLVPCEHILHKTCYVKVCQGSCPICHTVPKSTMPFLVRSWDGESVDLDDGMSLADCEDSELWLKFVDEFKQSIKNDDFKNGVDVVVKQLDENRLTIRVPMNWTYGTLKNCLVSQSKIYTPCEIRLVVQGAPMNDADLVIDPKHIGKRPMIHFIRNITGS